MTATTSLHRPLVQRDRKPAFALPARAFAPARAALLVLLALVLPLVSGCGERAWQRSMLVSLETTRIGTEAAWSIAIENQRTSEAAAINDGAARAAGLEEAARLVILAEVQRELATVRARSHAVYARFRLVRQLHATAVAAFDAYRAGRGTRASFFAAMDPLLDAWRALQEILPNRGRPDAPADQPAPVTEDP
ncbi:MAG: hypothetical protein IPK85_01470 [Gemmatimonadetes bacterium]|nr:hypothetical protein [Gemmatimonadota bacterium]